VNTDPEVVRDVFASHYFFFAFMASLGTLQIATSNSGIRGLWLVPHRRLTRWLGVALILAGIAVFFAQPLWIEGPWAAGSVEADSVSREWGQAEWGDLAGARNVNDIHGGLDGTKQAIWFPLAAILAFAVSAIFGTLSVKILMKNVVSDARARDTDLEIADGLSGMVIRSYFANLPDSLRLFRAEIVDVWRTGLHSADRWSLFKMIFGRSQS
jgi:hypothetical protein